MESSSLIVLVVSEDRRLLRHLSRFLTTFGYQARPACGRQAAETALAGLEPDIVLLDGGRSWTADFCQSISAASIAKPIQTLLMLERADARQLVDAVAAGVDDFLQKPIIYGELLSRMRAAARALGFEHATRRHEGIDPLTGLMNEPAFDEILRTAVRERAACVVVDLDFLEGVNRLYGRRTGDRLICLAADTLVALAPETPLAHLGGGRFGALLRGATVLEAESWAEEARRAIAQIELVVDAEALRITASAGLVTAKDGGEQWLAKACETLRLAKQSGRDSTVRAGQFVEETRAWSELATPGKLFERTRARDVMVSLPLALEEGETVDRAARLLKQTRLEALPVVNRAGSLVGAVTAEMPLANLEATVAEVMLRDVATFEEETSFASLLKFFTSDERGLAIVVHRQWPTGLLTPDRLALLSQPVTLDEVDPSLMDTCTSTSTSVPSDAVVSIG